MTKECDLILGGAEECFVKETIRRAMTLHNKAQPRALFSFPHRGLTHFEKVAI
jgi:hypothetical protein